VNNLLPNKLLRFNLKVFFFTVMVCPIKRLPKSPQPSLDQGYFFAQSEVLDGKKYVLILGKIYCNVLIFQP
jgi:hypothetical protein